MYDYLLTSTDNMISSYIFGAWNSFNAVANPWITGMLALYVVIMGYLVWLGRANMSFSDLGPRIFKMAVIYVLVTNIGLLTVFLYNTFIDIPISLIDTLYSSTSDDTATLNSKMTDIYDKGIAAAKAISSAAGYNVILHIYSFLITLLTTAVITVAAGYIILGKLAVAVLLALAPFFIMMYLFAGTKSLFEGWLRQILTFSLIPVLVYSLLLLIVSLLGQTSEQFFNEVETGQYNIPNIAAYTVVCLISILLLTQVKAWAAGIAGGFQLSSLGAFKGSISGGIAAGRAGARLNQWRKNRQASNMRKSFK